MVWAVPQYSRTQVDRAGEILSSDNQDPVQLYEAFTIINNWRAAHQYPLNTFQMTLRRRSKKFANNPMISQRIKRLESIERKLLSGTIKLSQMQDIGGCRSVLESAPEVLLLRDAHLASRAEHIFKNQKDYILNPKDDGYRGVHLIFRYKGSPKYSVYDKLQIEVQIRSQMQHAWATAVEAVGTFTKQALKWRGGDAEWHRFFSLMSSAIAKLEESPCVPGTPNNKQRLGREIKQLAQKIRVRDTLAAYNLTLDYVGKIKKSAAKILLVHMIPTESKVTVLGYRLRESQLASEDYTKLERNIDDRSSEQAVLVRVDSLQALQRAYPNYFLDTQRFSEILKEVYAWA